MTLSSHNHAKEVVPVYWGEKVVVGEVFNIEEGVLFVKLPFIAGYLLTTPEQVSTLEDIIRAGAFNKKLSKL